MDDGTRDPFGFLARQWRTFTSHMEPAVFIPAASLVVGFVVFGTGFSEAAASAFESAQAFIVDTFGWFYVLSTTILLIGVLTLIFGPAGRIKLGKPDEEPEFPRLTWFTMMLSAGMGIGIVFFGVAEPIQHFAAPPTTEGGTREAALEAMRFTFFHWGVHPWAIYSAIALPIAFFHFREGLPMAPRSMLHPLIGDRIHGPIGHAVDTLCVVGTLFGVATSLGLGATQINAGLDRLAGAPQVTWVQIVIIAAITLIATVSVVSGIKIGIRRLSEGNIGLMMVLLLFVFIAGPTVFQLDLLVAGLGRFVQTLPGTSLRVAVGVDQGWQADWTLFYWSWWISWSPFVGVFTARISRGRSIREFVLTAMLVPAGLGFLWFAVVGGTGIEAQLSGRADIAASVVENEALSLYELLDLLPLSSVTAVLATLLIVVFFITSSDSGSLVDDMVTSGGDPNPPSVQRVFWAVSEGAVAITLLVAGGLSALRTASLTTGLPIALLLMVGVYGLRRAITRELRRQREASGTRIE